MFFFTVLILPFRKKKVVALHKKIVQQLAGIQKPKLVPKPRVHTEKRNVLCSVECS